MDEFLKSMLSMIACDAILTGVIVWCLQRWLGKRLDAFDGKREGARIERAKAERVKIEQRDAERTLILAMSRTMLLNNYEKCVDKGCYTVEEREVYHKLYEAYKKDGGNSVIDEIAPRIRELPMEPPREHRDHEYKF